MIYKDHFLKIPNEIASRKDLGGGGGVGDKILRPRITIFRSDTHTCRRKGFIIRSESMCYSSCIHNTMQAQVMYPYHSVADPREGPGGPSPCPPPPLFLDQTEAQRAKKKVFLRLPPLISGSR